MDAFIVSRISSAGSASTSYRLKGSSRSDDFQGARRRRVQSSLRVNGAGSLQEVENVHINGTKIDGSNLNLDAPRYAVHQEFGAQERERPPFNAVLAAIAAVLLASQQTPRYNPIAPPKKDDVPVDVLRQGRLVENRLVYRQTFVIRSYEVGADRTASIETLMNHFQETALNHVWMSGLAGDGFGATHAMIEHNLIWVVSRMHVQAERYPAWGDAIEIDTWVAASGKNGMRRDWLVRNYKSGQILARATSTWVMMNQTTRRLSKMPEDVRMEISPFYLGRSAIVNDISRKIIKLHENTDFARTGLTPKHGDLDMNQHVNNVKYIGWMLESVPLSIVQEHELSSITLEYRRECGQDDIVQSMACVEEDRAKGAVSDEGSGRSTMQQPLCFLHLLRMQNDGSEIVRGRTVWRAKKDIDLPDEQAAAAPT